jgi:dTDP-4-dehydrorhamnose reductase
MKVKSVVDSRSTLVLGSGGFLGTYFAKAIPNASRYFRSEETDPTSQRSIENPEDIKDLIEIFQPKIVINCLALADLERCEKNPELAYWTNSEIPKLLAEFSIIHNYKLIHFSTDAIFLDSDLERHENVEVRPSSIYAKSKFQGEIEVLKMNSEHLVCRTNFFGFDEKQRNIFSFFASMLSSGRVVDGYSDSFFNPVYVEDLVRMTLELIDVNAYGLYHVSGNTKISKAEFGLKVAKAMNLNTDLVKNTLSSNDSRWNIRTKDLFLDNSKLKKLGISPTSLEQGILKAVEVWKLNLRSNKV